jgi:methionine-rich copper-binding protein CopC
MAVLRVAVLVVLGALVVGGPVLGAAAPAQAHNYLVSSTPAADQTLTELPEQFQVTTNGPLLTLGGSTGGFALEVKDAAGKFYGDGCVTVEGPTMSTAAALGAAGTYMVVWQVVSSDGHTVSDEFTFEWAPADGQVASEGSTTVPDCNGTAGGQAADPGASAPTSPDQKVDLGNVLWIGGAVIAVGLAVGVTLLVLGRRKKA